MPCADLRVFLLTFTDQNTRLKFLNYIPTLCSRAKFLFLVPFLNLAAIHGNLTFEAWATSGRGRHRESGKTGYLSSVNIIGVYGLGYIGQRMAQRVWEDRLPV